MSARVCPGDGNANNSDERIAIHPEDMAKAVELGIVPDEVVAAGKTHVTQDEMHLYSTLDETNFMSTGMTAWRAIAFALERDLDLPNWVKQYLSNVANGIEDWAALNEHDPPPLKWSAVMFRKTEDQNGYEETQAGRDCHEAAAG
ncbi:hypothetical protein [Phycobacter azelaicus]|uniref:hypothetical protein n=1 Tax=Phycobacter azelaicus TaxID=2668075 RepID=UPI001866D24E|nr:hypothetical protein [Phycobacter azelaicus]